MVQYKVRHDYHGPHLLPTIKNDIVNHRPDLVYAQHIVNLKLLLMHYYQYLLPSSGLAFFFASCLCFFFFLYDDMSVIYIYHMIYVTGLVTM